MTDESKSLLDLMLDESAKAPSKQKPEKEATIAQPSDVANDQPSWPRNVEEVLDLSGVDLRKWLAEVSPGDLLCVVAEGSEALRTRVLGSLDEASVTWLRDNIKLWDPATDALKEKSRSAVLVVARKLIDEGHIALPGSLDSEGQEQDTERTEARDQLAETLFQLVAIAHGQGVEALESVVEEAVHPMLSFGLRCVLSGDDPGSVEASLHDRQKALETAYRTELGLIRQALVAIARGDSPKAFLARVRPSHSTKE